VLLSKTHDDQRMSVADILYPYASAAREAVAAVRVLGVRKEIKDLGDMQLLYDVPEVEVYLKAAVDAETAPALAPPWSATPWLVTAGPYVLGKVTPESASLVVFRDFTYPLGVGSFDQYPIPLPAFIVKTERRGERLEIQADVENIEKFARSYKIVREPFRPQPASEKFREPLTVHFSVLGPNDEVAAAGTSRDVQNGRLVVDLAGRLKPGAYRVLLALALNGK